MSKNKGVITMLAIETVLKSTCVYAGVGHNNPEKNNITQAEAISASQTQLSNMDFSHHSIKSEAYTRAKEQLSKIQTHEFFGSKFHTAARELGVANADDSTETVTPNCYTPPCHHDHSDCGSGTWF